MSLFPKKVEYPFKMKCLCALYSCMSDHKRNDMMHYLRKQNFVAMGLYFT